ncbi:hypothetical protein H4I95_12098 [Botrytis cinerea]
MLVGNALVHKEYKRRWRAVKDLRDVYVRFNQAASWYDRYNMSRNYKLKEKWFDYLWALNIEQFNADIWKEMLKSHKHSPELSPSPCNLRETFDFATPYAEWWLAKLLHLVRLTHWVLPYPTHLTLIASTKTNHNTGLKKRMMWFSSVYANPEKVTLPLKDHPQNPS